MHIDWWTLALQTVNVLILIWVLGRFFFRPVADVVAKRQADTTKLLADAEAARKETFGLRAEAEKARANVAAERDRLTTEARKEAQLEKNALLAQSSAEIAQQRAQANAAIARERAAVEQAVLAHASELSINISSRLLTRLPSEVSFPAFLDGLCDALRDLSPEARASCMAADKHYPLDIVTAIPLTEDQTATVTKSLCGVFGVALSLTFRSDPALIAGIELHGRNEIVRNSWQADLQMIREELNRDGHNGQS